ncbi:hypothetical protein [Arundinibacter roseus]|uniref:Neutral/alkaline non-lysosomal ceramidase N-terminal domain-containing protein n=1 Tax=Arundinibacter roseus TaxID=2070510 RepID=A0A4R4K383_9BACT|nr:hypothetical protein [Arundinibacter roseus]TDB61770.1 hypothetical protein EZE20_18655 [Arundinibacter roseus]
MLKKTLSLVLLCSLLLHGAKAQTLNAGAAKRLLTPDPLLPVSGGIGTPKPSLEKKGDLFVRAMVLQKGETKVAFVSIDNLGWPAQLGDQSRALVKGIAPENILIAATHTHSAPDAYGFPNAKGETFADLNYLNWCVKQVAEAIQEALANLQLATLKIGMGEAKGKIAYNYYAPDLYDPRCGVIQAVAAAGDRKGQPIVTLVNYAVHPEVIGSGRGILSPDLCGPLYDRIEKQVGGMALFMNGAQGGMVTADVRLENGKEANTWEECIRIGELLADEALRIVATAPPIVNPELTCMAQRFEFPIESDIMKFIIQKSSLNYSLPKPDTIQTQVNLVTVGPAQILTIPGEALPNIGYYLKRKMPTDFPFLFGLTNDAFGYMLTKVDFTSFKRYSYVSETSLGEMTGELFIEQALRLIQESPKPVSVKKDK